MSRGEPAGTRRLLFPDFLIYFSISGNSRFK